MWRHLPAAYPAKPVPPFSSSKNWLHSCRLSIAQSVGQTIDGNRARLHSLFSMKFTQVPSQYSKQIKEVQVTIKVWVHANAPSCHVSCKSSAALQLFKQWTALLQTIDCRKVWDKQPTGAEQVSPHCWVWNSQKCPANTAKKLEK
jgi:hypothetical protein